MFNRKDSRSLNTSEPMMRKDNTKTETGNGLQNIGKSFFKAVSTGSPVHKQLKTALLEGNEEKAIQIFSSKENAQGTANEIDPSKPFPSKKSQYDETPILLAAKFAMVRLFHLFLANGGNPKFENLRSENCLHMSCSMANGDLVRVELIDLIMNWKKKNTGSSLISSRTSLQSKSSEVEAVDDEQVQVDHVDCDGNAAIHQAAANGLVTCVKRLVHYGALLSIINNDYLTCCDIADRNGHTGLATSIEIAWIFLKSKDERIQASDNYHKFSNERETAKILLDCNSLSLDGVNNFISQAIKFISNALGENSSRAEVLLQLYHWDCSKLKREYLQNPENVLAAAKLQPKKSEVAVRASSKLSNVIVGIPIEDVYLDPCYEINTPFTVYKDNKKVVYCIRQHEGKHGVYPHDFDITKVGEIHNPNISETSHISPKFTTACTLCGEMMMEEASLYHFRSGNLVKPKHREMKCNSGHKYCFTCWVDHLQTKVIQDVGVGCLSCLNPECGEILDLQWAPIILKSSDLVNRLHVQRQRRVIDAINLKWCPVPNCGLLVHIHPGGSHSGSFFNSKTQTNGSATMVNNSSGGSLPNSKSTVDHTSNSLIPTCFTCASSHSVCTQCLQEAHSPCTCAYQMLWQEEVREVTKLADEKDPENLANMLISAPTSKRCPRCTTSTTKDQGSNHIICSNCHSQYCWICLRDWSLHDGSQNNGPNRTSAYFRCNRYLGSRLSKGIQAIETLRNANSPNPTQEGVDEQKNHSHRSLKSEKTLYLLHNFSRFQAHGESLRLEKSRHQETMLRISNALKDCKLGKLTWLHGDSIPIPFKEKGDVSLDDEAEVNNLYGGVEALSGVDVKNTVISEYYMEQCNESILFLEDAFVELHKCRSILRWSYPFSLFQFEESYQNHSMSYTLGTRTKNRNSLTNSSLSSPPRLSMANGDHSEPIINNSGTFREHSTSTLSKDQIMEIRLSFDSLQSLVEMKTEELSDLVAGSRIKASKSQISLTTREAKIRRIDFENLILSFSGMFVNSNPDGIDEGSVHLPLHTMNLNARNAKAFLELEESPLNKFPAQRNVLRGAEYTNRSESNPSGGTKSFAATTEATVRGNNGKTPENGKVSSDIQKGKTKSNDKSSNRPQKSSKNQFNSFFNNPQLFKKGQKLSEVDVDCRYHRYVVNEEIPSKALHEQPAPTVENTKRTKKINTVEENHGNFIPMPDSLGEYNTNSRIKHSQNDKKVQGGFAGHDDLQAYNLNSQYTQDHSNPEMRNKQYGRHGKHDEYFPQGEKGPVYGERYDRYYDTAANYKNVPVGGNQDQNYSLPCIPPNPPATIVYQTINNYSEADRTLLETLMTRGFQLEDALRIFLERYPERAIHPPKGYEDGSMYPNPPDRNQGQNPSIFRAGYGAYNDVSTTVANNNIQPSPFEQRLIGAKKNPDQEALDHAILISLQEQEFGVNMYEAIRHEDENILEEYMELGFTREEAILVLFEKRFGKVSSQPKHVTPALPTLHKPSTNMINGMPNPPSTMMVIRSSINPPAAEGSTAPKMYELTEIDEPNIEFLMRRGFTREQAVENYLHEKNTQYKRQMEEAASLAAARDAIAMELALEQQRRAPNQGSMMSRIGANSSVTSPTAFGGYNPPVMNHGSNAGLFRAGGHPVGMNSNSYPSTESNEFPIYQSDHMMSGNNQNVSGNYMNGSLYVGPPSGAYHNGLGASSMNMPYYPSSSYGNETHQSMHQASSQSFNPNASNLNDDIAIEVLMGRGLTRDQATQLHLQTQRSRPEPGYGYTSTTRNFSVAEEQEILMMMNRGFSREQACNFILQHRNSVTNLSNTTSPGIVSRSGLPSRSVYQSPAATEYIPPTMDEIEAVMSRGYTKDQAVEIIENQRKFGQQGSSLRDPSFSGLPPSRSIAGAHSRITPPRPQRPPHTENVFQRQSSLMMQATYSNGPSGGYHNETGIMRTPSRAINNNYSTPQSGLSSNRTPDQEAFDIALLISQQETEYGINMYDAVTPADEPEIENLKSQGHSADDAILILFNRRYRSNGVTGNAFHPRLALQTRTSGSTHQSNMSSNENRQHNYGSNPEDVNNGNELTYVEPVLIADAAPLTRKEMSKDKSRKRSSFFRSSTILGTAPSGNSSGGKNGAVHRNGQEEPPAVVAFPTSAATTTPSNRNSYNSGMDSGAGPVAESDIRALMTMGFSRDQVVQSLRMHDLDVQRAANYLVGNG